MPNLRHDPAQRGPVAAATIVQALGVVHASNLVSMLELWEKQDRTHAGGRPPYLSMRATLALWLTVATEQQAMLLTHVADILRNRLTPKTCGLLGIAYEPDASPSAMYERARIATNRIFRLIDAFPLKNRQRRLTKGEYLDELRCRDDMRDILDTRARRAGIFRNQLMEATYQLIPKRYRPERMSVVVDATRIPTYSRGIGKESFAKLADTRKISSDPDFAFYVRTTKGTPAGENAVAQGLPVPKGESIRISEYSLEHELAVMTTPEFDANVPHLIVGLESHTPGADPIGAARSIVDSLHERGHDIDHFTGDRAYLPGGPPEELVNVLREAGTKLIMDYPKTRLGSQMQQEGAILVDGNWYCPSMPPHLIAASKVYRETTDPIRYRKDPESKATVTAAKAVWRLAVVQRETYLFRPKESPDERGRVPLMCPAAGNAPAATCTIKPNAKGVMQAQRNGRELLNVVGFKKSGKVCTNKTSTSFHVNDGGSLEQYYQYGSEEWERKYHYMRNRVEAMNGYAKDNNTFDMANSARRRMRGYTAQSALVALTFVAVNLKILRDFLLEQDEREVEAAHGIVSPARRTNRTRRSDAEARKKGVKRNRGRGETMATAGAAVTRT